MLSSINSVITLERVMIPTTHTGYTYILVMNNEESTKTDIISRKGDNCRGNSLFFCLVLTELRIDIQPKSLFPSTPSLGFPNVMGGERAKQLQIEK